MQTASGAFDSAMDGVPHWVKPTLRAGWHGNEPAAPSGARLSWLDVFDRGAIPDGWSNTTRYTWDATIEGWVGEGATSVARVTTPTHDGAGSLQATETMGAGFSSLRFNDAQGVRDLSAGGTTLTAWVLVPAGSPGTGWQARIEVQNTSFAWQAGPNYTIVPGVWSMIRFTPAAGLLANCRSIGFEIGATGVNGAQNVYVDTLVQWPTSDIPEVFWYTDTPTLLDAVSGSVTIANNVIDSTRGARYEILDRAGTAYLVDWEVTTVVSANAVPTGAPFSWVIRFGGSGGNWVDLFVGVTQTTNQVYYLAFRNYPTSQSDTLKSQTNVPGLVYAANKKLGVRVAYAGGKMMWTVWDYDLGNEPMEWLEVVTDIRASFSGKPELRSHLSPSNTNGTVTFSFYRFGLVDVRVLDEMPIGDSYTVSHGLDDGMPSAITGSANSDPYGDLSADLTGRDDMDARQHFSPFNADSPVSYYPRDIAPVRLDHGAMTDNGEEWVRLFTGQMVNIPISGRTASVDGYSSTRMKLAKAVTVPLLRGQSQGGEASWVASYVLWKCGVQAMPPPDERGLQFWAPAHGSLRPFVPFPQSLDTVYSNTTIYPPAFRSGPFYRASNSQIHEGVGQGYWYNQMGTRYSTEGWGDHWMLDGQATGRLEFYIYGDESHPGWNAGPIGEDVIMSLHLSNSALFKFTLFITNGRELVIRIYEHFGITNPVYLNTGLVLPVDQEWHHVGFYWDVEGNTFMARIDGNERTITPSPAISLTNLQGDVSLASNPRFTCVLPWSDLQFYSGQYSDPVDYGWNDRLTRVDGAQNVLEDWEDTTYNVTWLGSWARANDQAAFGSWSLKSSAIGNYAFSSMWVTVPANSRVMQFWLRTDTEQNADFFQVMAPYVYSNFSSVVSNGFGTPEIGPGSTQWNVLGTASEYASNGTVGTMSLATVSTERAAYFDTTSQDGDITADISFGVGSATGDVLRMRVRGRGSGLNMNNNIYAQLELDTSGNVRLAIQENLNAVTNTIASGVVVGSNGAGSTWRVRFQWWHDNVRATAYNVTTPSAPVTVSGKSTYRDLDGNVRVFLTAVRTPSNTNATTVTWDNVLVNEGLLFEASGASGGWRLVSLDIPATAPKVLMRYAKSQSTAVGGDAAWIDSLEFRQAPSITNSFMSQAILREIPLYLQTVVQPTPREGWTWIAELCQSALTSIRVDELDRFMLLSPGYWTETAQLAIADTLTTDFNASDPDMALDPSKIRNSVQVDYTDTWIDSIFSIVLRYKTVLALPPGRTEFTFTLDVPIVELKDTFAPEFGTDPPSGWPPNENENGVWINTVSDGTGTYINTVNIEILSYNSSEAVLAFTNPLTSTVYLVNDFEEDVPYLTLSGLAVHTNETSVTRSDIQGQRGERSLTIQGAWVQGRDQAIKLADSVLFWTRKARPEVALSVFGDPRRQPGDLYTLADAQGTELSGKWRAMAIVHKRSGAAYTQDILLKQAVSPSLWDDNSVGWDEGVWVD
jgi:hypothetical protein